MTEKSERPVGFTRDVGYQIGARRTFPFDLQSVWETVTSTEGLNLWLGPTSGINFAKGAAYELADGSCGEVRVYSPGSHLRMTWWPQNWQKASTIQVRVIPKEGKTVVAFHQENLPGPEEREQRQTHFKTALDQLDALFCSKERKVKPSP